MDAPCPLSSTVDNAQPSKHVGIARVVNKLLVDEEKIKSKYPLTAFPLTPSSSSAWKEVHFIQSPPEFYDTLLEGVGKAKDRIVLSSLYLGLGAEEQRLVHALSEALTRQPDLRLTILLDYFRGQRQSHAESSLSLLQPLQSRFGEDRVQLSFYHTPALASPLLKHLIPARFNETLGLQHTKIYAFDNQVILSGANLSHDYFTNRQDRYIKFTDARISNFYCELVHVLSSFSFRLSSVPKSPSQPNLLMPPAHWSDKQKYKSLVSESLSTFLRKWSENMRSMSALHTHDHNERVRAPYETFVIPSIQLGQFNIRQDERLLHYLFERFLPDLNLSLDTTIGQGAGHKIDVKSRITLMSGYFNIPSHIVRLFLSSRSSIYSVITSSPQANGFYGSKGVSGYIPAAYSHLLSLFQARFVQANRAHDLTIYEYIRKGWTFHAKGLFIRPDVTSMTLRHPNTPSLLPLAGYRVSTIGSSNYNYRSFRQDVEAQALILTNDPALMGQMDASQDSLLGLKISADSLKGRQGDGAMGAEGQHVCVVGSQVFAERHPSLMLRIVTRLLARLL